MKLADVTYLFRWLIIHINIFLITLKFMMTFVTCVAFHIIHDYSIFEQKNGSEKNHLKFKGVIKNSRLENCPFRQRIKLPHFQ